MEGAAYSMSPSTSYLFLLHEEGNVPKKINYKIIRRVLGMKAPEMSAKRIL
jgi:hypothetical protein